MRQQEPPGDADPGLLKRLDTLSAALDLGFTLTLSDVSVVELAALRILRDEREKHRELKAATPRGTFRPIE